MAKKKQLDEFLDETPTELPEPEPEPKPVLPVGEQVPVMPDNPPDTPAQQGAMPSSPVSDSQPVASEWTAPAGCIVGDDPEGARPYKIRVGGQLYRHVSNAPDGNWVYEPDV